MIRAFIFLLLISSVALAANLSGLPKTAQGFEKWTVVAKNLDQGGPHSGQSKRVFANKTAAAAWKKPGALPIGSIVIKTAGDIKKPSFIAIMEKRKNGWYFEEYFPKGSKYALGAGGPKGQALCTDCHEGGQDQLFTR
jgi:Cytochrome P460